MPRFPAFRFPLCVHSNALDLSFLPPSSDTLVTKAAWEPGQTLESSIITIAVEADSRRHAARRERLDFGTKRTRPERKPLVRPTPRRGGHIRCWTGFGGRNRPIAARIIHARECRPSQGAVSRQPSDVDRPRKATRHDGNLPVNLTNPPSPPPPQRSDAAPSQSVVGRTHQEDWRPTNATHSFPTLLSSRFPHRLFEKARNSWTRRASDRGRTTDAVLDTTTT